MFTRSPWVALTVLCLPMLMVSMDTSVLFFAVPAIAGDLNPTPTEQLWIFDVYGFVLAGLLLTMGTVADRIGHRKLLLIGATAFSAASLMAAFAPGASALIVARAILGLAGATLMPSTLAMIRHVFDDDAARAKAVATWNAVLAGGVALGPIVSGLLLEHFWWGSVFLINVPTMALLLVLGRLLLPGDTAVPGRRVDAVSAVLAVATILPVVWGIKELAAHGWSMTPVMVLLAGLALSAVFVRRQRHLDDPMIDLRLLGERRFGTSVWINLVCMFALLGNAVLMTQYLQSVLGYSPLRAALWSVLPSVFVGAVAPLAAVGASRFGRPVVIVAGLIMSVAGFVVLAIWTGLHSLPTVLVGATLLAAGAVATTSMIADYVVSIAPTERAGATSGLLETSSELGGALGIAVLGSVVNAVFRTALPHHLPSGTGTGTQGSDTLAGALTVAGHLPAQAGTVLADAARTAFVDGLTSAAVLGAVILGVTAVIGALALRGRRTDRSGEVGIAAIAD